MSRVIPFKDVPNNCLFFALRESQCYVKVADAYVLDKEEREHIFAANDPCIPKRILGWHPTLHKHQLFMAGKTGVFE